MSKRSRKKTRPAVHAAIASPKVNVLPTPVEKSEVDKQQDRMIAWSFWIAIASFALNVALGAFAFFSASSASKSATEAETSNKLAKAAQDRVTGKTKAKFDFVDESYLGSERYKEFMRKKDGFDQTVFRIESVDDLMRWSPYVRIKNLGDEPIDAIKTDVHYDFGAAYGLGVYQIDPPPIVINETSTFQTSEFGKLDPGRTARVYVAPLLLSQMIRGNKEFPDKDRLGVLTVNMYCRLVNAPSYDRVSDEQPVVFTFHWRPTGFRQDANNVKELLEKKPWVMLD